MRRTVTALLGRISKSTPVATLVLVPAGGVGLPRSTAEYTVGRPPCLRAEVLRVARSGILRCALVCAAITTSSCSESPFSPAPAQRSCGGTDWPCPFDCKLDCAAASVRASQSCVLTLEGTLDSARTRCSFADGSRVVFRNPVPPAKAALASAIWDFSIERRDKSCLTLRTLPPQPDAGLLHNRASVDYPGGAYQQELWLPVAGDGGSAGRGPERARVTCSDGRVYEGPASPCYSCGDAAGCRLSGLLELRVRADELLEFSLASGDELAPLFTCR